MKKGVVLLWLLVALMSDVGVVFCTKKPPHILFILADDWGWGDVSWSEYADIPTPHIARLRSEGLELMHFYSQPKCTAARAALMTGRYPYKMGLQTNKVFTKVKNNTLDPDLKLLPAYLKDQGYHTHMVGKWHLGHCNANATPIYRGFDTHFGAWGNTDNHFNLTHSNNLFDWNWQNEPYWPAQGTFSAHLITNHTQHMLTKHFTNDSTKDEPVFLYVAHLVPHKPAMAPEKYITNTTCNDIPEFVNDTEGNLVPNIRRPYCGMVAAMDEGIGNITDTLRSLGVLDDFLIIVTSDNGGAIDAGANNYPLRGNKQTVYEGGTRVRTVMRGPKFLKATGEYQGLMHITDMLPTLVRAAGADPKQVLPMAELDGKNLWHFLRNGLPSTRKWMVYNIDSDRELGAVRFRKNATYDYKLIYSNATIRETGYRYQQRGPDEDWRLSRYRRKGQAYFLYDLVSNEVERPPNNFLDATKLPENRKLVRKMINKLARFTEDEMEVPTYYPLAKHQKNGAYRVAGC